MSKLVQQATTELRNIIRTAMEKACANGELPQADIPEFSIEVPADRAHGDWATNAAMVSARAFHAAPRKIAEAITNNLALNGTYFDRFEIAGPGFINFFLSKQFYVDVLKDIEALGDAYGRSEYGQGKKIMVEFVSANPTGPMHMGNARGGALGDCLAAVLDAAGYSVWREFYVNDAGNQIEKFGNSLEARYLQIYKGEDAVEFPEDGYHGDDIRELAQAFRAEHGDGWLEKSEEERQEAMAQFGLSVNVPKMKEDLRRYQIEYDEWFFESSLHESGYVRETVEMLTQRGWTYEKEGALWLNTTELLKEKYMREGKTREQADKLDLKDDVLRRANGFYTYFAADIAYHRNKLEKRGFSKAVNIWGADHHGHVARLQAALDGLGLDGSHRLVVVLMQLVNLLQDGKPVRMSKRSGKAIALHDLLDEISVDAARYFFNSRSSNSPLDFDLDLAVEETSQNPVYYVQYAHARICSILKNLAAEGISPRAVTAAELDLLATGEEKELIRKLATLPEEIIGAAKNYDPARLTHYVIDIATLFHKFYNACRVKGEEESLMQARLALCIATRTVIENVLGLLKITAPESM